MPARHEQQVQVTTASDEAAQAVMESIAERLEATGVITATRSRLDLDRLRQGTGAVLSAYRAAQLLPIDTADALAWLEEQGLVRHLGHARVCIWQDVLEALRARRDEHADDRNNRPSPVRRGPPPI